MTKQNPQPKTPHLNPSATIRQKIQFYLIDCKTLPSKLIDIILLLLNLLFIGIFILETYPISQSTKNTLWTLELFIVGIFIIEYFTRLYGAEKRIRYIFSIYGIIDLITLLPTISMLVIPIQSINLSVIKIMRIFKAIRIFRFLRFTQDPYFFFGKITTHLLRVVQLIFIILTIFFISSGLFWQVENSINPNVETFGDAFYFTVVALTTVGFGDILPISEAGRIITILMILSGIILIPWQVSKIVREWVNSNKKRVICKKCGLTYHDGDASHCKSCGNIIYQEFDGN